MSHPRRELPQCIPSGIHAGEEAVSVKNMMIYVQRLESAYTQAIAQIVRVEDIPAVCRIYLDLRAKIDG